MDLTETQIVHQVLEYLLLRGHYVWRNNTGAMKLTDKGGKSRFFRAGKVGSADILGVARDGRFLAVECKTEKGKTTPAQDEFLREVKCRGGIAVVARGIEDLDEL